MMRAVQMRLMALLALCSTKEGMEVSFKEVEQALALEEGQAEGWLVQAFGKQLLDGRINQVCTSHWCIDTRAKFDGKQYKRVGGQCVIWALLCLRFY
jgi:hypothetical protein